MTRALPLLMLLAGCAAVRGGDAPVTMRVAPTFAEGAPAAGSIAVAPVLARGLAGDRRYTYVTAAAPGELRQAASLFWEEPPPRLLERALADALATRYAQVYPTATPLAADRRVVATLTRFEEAEAGAAPRATVAFDASVTRNGRVERTGRWCASEPIVDATGTTRAKAFETALAAAVSAFVMERAADC